MTDSNGARNRTSGRSNPASRHHDGVTLNDAIMMWSTPRSSDGEKGGPNQAFGAGGVPLPAQAYQWATPSVADTTGGRMTRSGARSDEMLLKGQAETLSSFLPALPTSTRGGASSNTLLTAYRRYRATTDSTLRSERRALLLMAIRAAGKGWTRKAPTAFRRPSFRRSLNPSFVGWLMGWPPIASTGFGFSATAWCLWHARMRSALSRLALPDAAPPAQLALFG